MMAERRILKAKLANKDNPLSKESKEYYKKCSITLECRSTHILASKNYMSQHLLRLHTKQSPNLQLIVNASSFSLSKPL